VTDFVDRQQELFEVRERLEDDQVRSAFEEAIDLLAERGSRGRLREDRATACRRSTSRS
jgi:Ran GTPase-activating protein (RanGAP) involved in mRNA processing and transport